MSLINSKYLTVFFFVLLGLGNSQAESSELWVGSATVDITPKLPVSVDGQMALRVAGNIETPLEANIVVLETKGNGQTPVSSVWVTCDIVTIPTELLELIRTAIAAKVPGLDTDKVIVNASHTHTAGVVRANWYPEPDSIMKVVDYQRFIAGQVADGVALAWKKRGKGAVSWGLGYARVAYNRRASYADGSSQMYGNTSRDDFRHIEGYEDQSIQSLFFWDQSGKLVATCINIASPAQVVESRSVINADYWHPVRQRLRARYGKQLGVVGWIGAAGDQTPRPMFDQKAETRMLSLRNRKPLPPGFSTDVYLQEVARRIVACVEEVHDLVKNDKHTDPVLVHQIERFELPMRLVTENEFEDAKKQRDQDRADPAKAVEMKRRIAWQQEVVDRYEKQKTVSQPMYPVEVHILRLGDISISTNPFELFTDYGIQMRARSKALQTFVVQLVGPGTYLPTAEAQAGGHYSAIVQSVRVGPEGGQILVDKSVRTINSLWP